MATAFSEDFAASLVTSAAEAHAVLLARCYLNILRATPRNPALVSVAIEEVANLEPLMLGAPGEEALCGAAAAASTLLDAYRVKSSRTKSEPRERRRRGSSKNLPDAVEAVADKLAAFLEVVDEIPGVFVDIERNLTHLASLFGFASDECALVLLSMACSISTQVDSFLDKCLGRAKSIEQVVGACLGIQDARAREILAPNGPLERSGVIKFDRGHRWFASAVEHHVALRYALTGLHDTSEQLRAALVGMPLSTHFDLEDFAHIGSTVERLGRLLHTARQEATNGVNILLHGRVGVGKTTLAKVIARDMALYAIGESDEDGREPKRDQRMHALLVAQQVLKGQEDSAILIDEAEDVLAPFRGTIFVNRMLETNAVPVIYIVNDAGKLPDAVKRRMTYILEVHAPPVNVRANMVRRVLEERGIAANDADVRRVAALGNIPPAIISNAAHAAALSGGAISTLLDGVKAVMRTLNVSSPEASATPDRYDPRFSCASSDLPGLIERLVHAPRQDWSLLLLGKPGTGKSAMARHVAERLGMPVLQLGGPQLMRPYVGETEKLLAAYFAQAKAERAFLIFDEIDSLAFNRSNSTRSWEVSHTNTLLELLQDHDLPMACCTNAEASHDRLDPAILRRFTFKIGFSYLTRGVARALFKHLFAVAAPTALDRLSCLTPGDFAVVAKKAMILGLGNPNELVAMLQAECAVKGERSQDIGFQMVEPAKTLSLAA